MFMRKMLAVCTVLVILIQTVQLTAFAESSSIILNYASGDYGGTNGDISVSGSVSVTDDAEGYGGKIALATSAAELKYIPKTEKGVYRVYIHKKKAAYGSINVTVNSLYTDENNSSITFNWGYGYSISIENDDSGAWVPIGTYYFSGEYGIDYIKCTRRDGIPAYFDAVKLVREEEQDIVILDEGQSENQLGSAGYEGVTAEELSLNGGGSGGTHKAYSAENRTVSAIYYPKVNKGCYDVYVNVPRMGYNAEMTIEMSDGERAASRVVPATPTVADDQYIENWYRVGVFAFGGTYGKDTIKLTAMPQSGRIVRFDAVKLVRSDEVYAYGPSEFDEQQGMIDEFNQCETEEEVKAFVEKYSSVMNINTSGLLMPEAVSKRLKGRRYTSYDGLYRGIAETVDSERENPVISLYWVKDDEAQEVILDPVRNNGTIINTGATEFNVSNNAGYDGNTTGYRAFWSIESSMQYIPELENLIYEVYVRTNIAGTLGANSISVVSGLKEVCNRNLNWSQISSENIITDDSGNKWISLGSFEFSGVYEQDYVYMSAQDGITRGYAYYDTVKFVPVKGSKVRITDMEQISDKTDIEITVRLCGADFVQKEAAAVAVYSKENRLEGVAINTFEDSADYEISLGRISNPAEVKLICFEDFRKMKPVDIYDTKIDLYASDKAEGGGSGTLENPFTLKEAKAAVAKLNDTMKRDIVVHLTKGTYTLTEPEHFGSELSGRNGCRVIFEGAEGETFISGGREITDWQEENGIWVAELPETADFRQLYVNGRKAQRARSRMYTADAGYEDESTDAELDGVVIADMPYASYTNPGAMELVYNVEWMNYRLPLNDVIAENSTTTFVGDETVWRNFNTVNEAYRPKAGAEFYVENAIEYLDEQGEFYFDTQERRLYYMPLSGEDINSVTAVAAVCEGLAKISGEYISFKNISFVYGGYTAANEGRSPCGQATVLADNTLLPAQLELENTLEVNIAGCEFKNLGSTAVALSDNVVGSWIDSNTISDVGGAAIEVGKQTHTTYLPENERRCVFNRISNNSITRIGDEFYSCPGIVLYYVGETTVENNEISDVPYTGISLGWGWGLDVYHCKNNRILRNRTENVMTTLEDGAHIYTLGPCRNSVVSGNYCIGRVPKFAALYADQGSAYMTWENNVVNFGGYSGRWLHGNGYVHDMTVRNNYVTDRSVTMTGNAADTFFPERGIWYDYTNIPDNVQQIINDAGIKNKVE